jgi:pre-mRNA-processing factor 39
LDEVRKAYETFLSEFPLCYVYWKKYADHELSKGNPHKVVEIYEKALTKAIPHSVDLWSHYCSYVAEKSDNLEEIRSLFDRGLEIVGTDYAAHPLWDKYLGFEISQEEYRRIGNIFSRILHIPLEQITSYWERYKSFVAERPLADIATDSELKHIKELRIDNVDKQKSWIVSEREKIYTKTVEQTNIRRPFETEALKINYFHVRPLYDTQLSNWAQYLEFEEHQGDHERTVKLYERCIIPCCNYTKFCGTIRQTERSEF